jgi:hypothetical protein
MNYKKLKAQNKLNEDMLETSIHLLKDANMNIEFLLNTLQEIEKITNDNLVKEMIKNAIEKHNLDKLCQNRVIFDN